MVYKILIREWYECYCDYKEESLVAPEEDCRVNTTQNIINQVDFSMINYDHHLAFTDESKIVKPVSFLDDTILSTKPQFEPYVYKYTTPLQKSLILKIEHSVTELYKSKNTKLVEAIYNKLLVYDNRDEKIIESQRLKLKRIFKAWTNFTEYCKDLKEKQEQVQFAISQYKLEICFKKFKSLLKLRAKRLKFENDRVTRYKHAVLYEFKCATIKCRKMNEAYIQVATHVRHKVVFECLSQWYDLAMERVEAKQAIAMEIERQKMEEQLEIQRQMEEKEQIIEYAENLYSLNLCRRALEAFKINKAPRKKFIGRLVEKYRMEQLKSKGLKSWKHFVSHSRQLKR